MSKCFQVILLHTPSVSIRLFYSPSDSLSKKSCKWLLRKTWETETNCEAYLSSPVVKQHGLQPRQQYKSWKGWDTCECEDRWLFLFSLLCTLIFFYLTLGIYWGLVLGPVLCTVSLEDSATIPAEHPQMWFSPTAVLIIWLGQGQGGDPTL